MQKNRNVPKCYCNVPKDLQASTKYKSRSQFLTEVLNPLMDAGIIYRDGNPKSPTALIRIKQL